jgi:hypothetical protein
MIRETVTENTVVTDDGITYTVEYNNGEWVERYKIPAAQVEKFFERLRRSHEENSPADTGWIEPDRHDLALEIAMTMAPINEE